jgi:hypothetical protein
VKIPLPTKFGEVVTRHKFVAYPHIRHLEKEVLRLLADKDQKGLIIEMSVRHGKSYFCSHILPAWYMTFFPNKTWQLTGYGNEFAQTFSVRARAEFLKTGLHSIDRGRNKADCWKVAGADGEMRSTSSGGSSGGGKLTGYGCNVLSCDDSVKSVAEANSLGLRNKMWDWWFADAYGTRLSPLDGSCLIIQARRHEDDLVGRQIAAAKESGAYWRRVTLPALARDDLPCPLGRKPGEPLCPELGFTADWLLAKKREFEVAGMSHEWEGLWQQNPMANPMYRDFDSTWFEDVYYDEIPPGFEKRFRILSIDPSKGSKSKSGDYAAFMDMTGTSGPAVWIEPYMKQLYSSAVEQQAVEMMAINNYDAVVMDGMHGQDIICRNVAKLALNRKINTPVFMYSTHDDKETRIRVKLSKPLSLGRIRFKNPKLCPGSAVAKAQFIAFPTGHDDAPDAVEQGYTYIEWMMGGRRAMMDRGITMEQVVVNDRDDTSTRPISFKGKE